MILDSQRPGNPAPIGRVASAAAGIALAAAAALASIASCGPVGSDRPAPRTAAGAESTPDGGYPPPKPSTRKGVIVPSDTGIGAGPSGSPSSPVTGSNKSPGPTFGN